MKWTKKYVSSYFWHHVTTLLLLTMLIVGRCFFSCAVHFWPISIKRCHRLSGHFGVRGSRRYSSLLQLSVRRLTYSTCNVFTSLFTCELIDWVVVFSQRELTFTFTICHRPSVCLSVMRNVREHYSGGSNFPQYFYGTRYLGHPLTSTENFTEIVLGEPLRRRS